MMNPTKPIDNGSIRVTVYPDRKTVVRLPTLSVGVYHSTFKVYVETDDVHFVTGDYSAIEFVNTDNDSDYGIDPLLQRNTPDFFYTGGAEYVAFRSQSTAATVRLEVVDLKGQGVSTTFEVVDDDYYTRYVSPLAPKQGYRMDSTDGLQDLVEDGGVTTRDLLWQGTARYTAPGTDTIRGGLGSIELRADAAYTRIEAADQFFDLDADCTFLVWNRYWDANSNGFVTGNVGILDFIDGDTTPGFRLGFIGNDFNFFTSGATTGSQSTNTASSGIKSLDGPWGLWVVRYDSTAQTASAWVRWPSGKFTAEHDTSTYTGGLDPSIASMRWGAGVGLSTTEGSLCEAYCWNRALADYELDQLYLGGAPR